MKLCLATYGDIFFKLSLKSFAESKKRYCEKHDIDYVFVEIVPTSYKAGWDKLRIIKTYLEYYDGVYITDMDSVVFDDSINIATLIPPHTDILCAELNNGFKLTGCSIWMNTPNTQKILDHLLYIVKDSAYFAEEGPFNTFPFDEFNVEINNTINCIYNHHEIRNPLMMHYAGIGNPYAIKKQHEKTLCNLRE